MARGHCACAGYLRWSEPYPLSCSPPSSEWPLQLPWLVVSLVVVCWLVAVGASVSASVRVGVDEAVFGGGGVGAVGGVGVFTVGGAGGVGVTITGGTTAGGTEAGGTEAGVVAGVAAGGAGAGVGTGAGVGAGVGTGIAAGVSPGAAPGAAAGVAAGAGAATGVWVGFGRATSAVPLWRAFATRCLLGVRPWLVAAGAAVPRGLAVTTLASWAGCAGVSVGRAAGLTGACDRAAAAGARAACTAGMVAIPGSRKALPAPLSGPRTRAGRSRSPAVTTVVSTPAAVCDHRCLMRSPESADNVQQMVHRQSQPRT